MSFDFSKPIKVSDYMKHRCPRQCFESNPKFLQTYFYRRYCKNLPCSGDHKAEAQVCWGILNQMVKLNAVYDKQK